MTSPVLYVPATQGFRAIRNPMMRSFGLHIYVRAARPISMIDAKRTIAGLDPNVAVSDVQSAITAIDVATRQPAFRVWLLGWFASVSLVLAAIGIYGLVSQTVAQRTREIGIRLALGATPGNVRFRVVRDALATAVVSSFAGCAVAVALGGILRTVLYGVRPGDPMSFLSACGALIGVVATAALVASARATRIEPIEALRSE
jgi:predicted lysophospholipase L1 biosynthesis ABC-type transport system permease subunit